MALGWATKKNRRSRTARVNPVGRSFTRIPLARSARSKLAAASAAFDSPRRFARVGYLKSKPTAVKSGAAAPAYPRTITFSGPKSKRTPTKKIGKKLGRL